MANYDIGTKEGRRRLSEAVRKSRQYLAPFRRNRQSHIKEYVGHHYSDSGASRAVPRNLIDQMHTVLLMELTTNNPRVLVTTEKRHLKGEAVGREYTLNNEIKRMNLARRFRGAVSNALFGGIGTVKTGIYEYGRFDYEGASRVLTRPYCEVVSQDDWVHDMFAECWDDIDFEGNRYRVPCEEVDGNDLYDQKLLKQAIDDSGYSTSDEYGEERTSAITRDEDRDAGESRFRRHYDFVDLWIPAEEKICTFLATEGKDRDWFIHGKPVRTIEWEGPSNGPFRHLMFKDVPDNTMPKSPIGDIRDMHIAVNALLNKIIFEAGSAKSVFMYSGAAANDANRVLRAQNMELLRSDHGPDAARLHRLDATNPAHMAFISHFGQIANEQGGNFALLGGMGPQSDTLGQDQLLYQSASKLVDDMQERTELFVRSVIEDIAHYLFSDPELNREYHQRIPNTDISVAMRMTQETLQGQFDEFEFSIEPYSMKPRSPQQRLAALTQVMQTAQQFAAMGLLDQQGVTIDAAAFLDTMARYLNVQPEFKDVITTAQEPLNVPGDPHGQSMPNDTKRTYERINRSGETYQGREQRFQNEMMSLAKSGMQGAA